VREQLPDRDPRAVGKQTRQVFGDGVIEPDLPLRDQTHDQHGGVALGRAADREDVARPHRHLLDLVCIPGRNRVAPLSLPDEENRSRDRPRDQRLDAVLDILWRRGHRLRLAREDGPVEGDRDRGGRGQPDKQPEQPPTRPMPPM